MDARKRAIVEQLKLSGESLEYTSTGGWAIVANGLVNGRFGSLDAVEADVMKMERPVRAQLTALGARLQPTPAGYDVIHAWTDEVLDSYATLSEVEAAIAERIE